MVVAILLNVLILQYVFKQRKKDSRDGISILLPFLLSEPGFMGWIGLMGKRLMDFPNCHLAVITRINYDTICNFSKEIVFYEPGHCGAKKHRCACPAQVAGVAHLYCRNAIERIYYCNCISTLVIYKNTNAFAFSISSCVMV